MVRRLRVVVVCTARIGLEHVIPAMKRSERCEVVAIASRDAQKARHAATERLAPRAYGDYGSLLNDTEVDAVSIPLPNHLHEPWTLAATEAGKHILCEKPLAPDVNHELRMIDGCHRAGVALQEAFMYRFHPQWRRVLELVSSGCLMWNGWSSARGGSGRAGFWAVR